MRRSKGATYGICVDCDPDGRVFEMIDAVNLTDDGKNPPVGPPVPFCSVYLVKSSIGATFLKTVSNAWGS